MYSDFYLPRKLSSNHTEYTEESLLATSKYVVILAEPGGGKTELLNSLAKKLGVTSVTANVFRYSENDAHNCPLVIDAFDELAKIDQTGIYSLLANARKANPTHLVISSRSSEWGNAATSAFANSLGSPPLVVKLFEFDESEQRAIFNNHVQGEDFSEFKSELARFDLAGLLPNPQFLKLFADAYIESERHFPNKRSIFAQAVEHLAKEVNVAVTQTGLSLSAGQKLEASSEVFAKLLLSGAEGISTTEVSENRSFPLLQSLIVGDKLIDAILATRLFRPGDTVDHHRPIHKIVAEYCAAEYLSKRIADPTDPFTLDICFAIIAPNSTVRDELRGVLGWMATLGNRPIQIAAIELDPYAVLSNGDPSQLEHSSKLLLIKHLKQVEAEDPYFRRGDFWRSFSVAGFFTQDVISELKPLLTTQSEGHLRDLVLEILKGSPALASLEIELRRLVLSPVESENTRLLAITCLLDQAEYDHRADLKALLFEGSQTSLNLSATIIQSLEPSAFETSVIADLLRKCANLYPSSDEIRERTIGSRYFVKRFINELSLPIIESLLDDFSKQLKCKCGNDVYECQCRNGMSKVVGSMMDRYFELAVPPYDPMRIWKWCENLNFHEQKTADQSKAVQVLKENNDLRRAIIAHVFARISDRTLIFKKRMQYFGWYGHAGLTLTEQDCRFIVDLAFTIDNADLWACFLATHQYYERSKNHGSQHLRRHMRLQANMKPLFMVEWIKHNKEAEARWRQDRMPRRALARRRKRHAKDDKVRAANLKYIYENRNLVESGRHWGTLHQFARFALMKPDQIEYWFGDEVLARNALKNCIDFITPELPDLARLAELQCTGRVLETEIILYAACLENLRARGSLEGIDFKPLTVLRTNINLHFDAVSNEERKALKTEIDRLIFANTTAPEQFLRQYIEPQIADSSCVNAEVWLLRDDDAFSHLRATLPLEWLRRYPMLALQTLDALFNVAAQFGDHIELKSLIAERSAQFMCDLPELSSGNNIDKYRTFWLVRAWYFLDYMPEYCWTWLKVDKEALLLFQERSGRMHSSDYPFWPKLTPRKIEALFDAFIEEWPKVDLPTHWGSGSPKEEQAYRFLTELVWSINADDSGSAAPVVERLLADKRLIELHKDLKSVRSAQLRKDALRNYAPPTPAEVIAQLDHNDIVTVESLRKLVLRELVDFQKAIDGGEFNSAARFYEKSDRLGEVDSTLIIAERLNLRLEPQGVTVTPEHQLKNANRSDFTASKIIKGRRRLLVTEVKGQWHKDLYTAAAAQLYDRYSIHPDAEKQGIFLVLWFGTSERVAGRKRHGISSARELKDSIEGTLPRELKGFIDVFVLDISRHE